MPAHQRRSASANPVQEAAGGLDTRKLLATIERLEKQYGKGIVYRLGAKKRNRIERLSTGVPQLDAIIGGGLPKGRITEIYGRESAGKTSLLYALMGRQKVRAFIDMEGTLEEDQAAVFGNVVGSNFFVSRPYWGEQAWDVLLGLAEAGIPLIGIDSVPAMIPRAVFERKDASVQDRLGAVAKLMSDLLPRLAAICDKTGSTVVFVNQERDNIGASLWQEQTRTPGGRALKHMCSLRLQLAHRGFITKKAKKVGMITKVRVKKSKVSEPQGECEIEHVWGKGFVNDSFR